MAELRQRPDSHISARALEFTILTAARTNEALGARWDEFDLAAKVWTCPASRTKSHRDHRVPLSPRALAILQALPRDGSFVFPGAKTGRPLSNMSMLELLKGMRPGLTVHGFRSTFSDWAREQTGYPRDVVEMCLAHVIKDKSEAAYRRMDALPKRTRRCLSGGASAKALPCRLARWWRCTPDEKHRATGRQDACHQFVVDSDNAASGRAAMKGKSKRRCQSS